MRLWPIIGIVVLLLVQSKEWVAIGSFKVHQKTIAKKWCTSANEKNNCCAGKCWLTRILDNIHDNESSEGVLQQLEERQQYEIPEEIISLNRPSVTLRQAEYEYLFTYKCSTFFPIFKPPC